MTNRMRSGWLCALLLTWAGAGQAQPCTPQQLQVDVLNCGSCGHSCLVDTPNSVQACSGGTCQFGGCAAGFHDLDGNGQCEYACTFRSAQESCNGVDDDCDGQIDENLIAPPSSVACGVSPGATAAECTTQVTASCVQGAWSCTFPASVCAPNCATASELCDGLDNNCNGQNNEHVSNFGAACSSDDAAPGTQGQCRTAGTIQCNGTCSAVKADCASLPGGCTELCDGKDNDCDGAIDEVFTSKGTDSANFVRPAVTRIAASTWIHSYEASRPSGAVTTQGVGNGYVSSAPAGVTLDATRACSEPVRLPWTRVTPQEAEQACTAAGGSLCTTAQYQSACLTTSTCTYGYSPRGAACTTTFTPSVKFCNLAPSFDFDPATAGDHDGLLLTGDPALKNCRADWSALQGNTTSTDKIFDITGNTREITRTALNDYRLMGGAYDHRIPAGAACTASDQKVDANYRYEDAGFRCCFSADPTL